MNGQHSTGHLTVHTAESDGWPLLMIGGPAGRIVANVNAESGVDTAKAPSIAFKKMPAAENARRLAACWNACEGISTEALELGAIQDRIASACGELHEVKRQRGALLAAARTMRSALDDLIARKPTLATALAGSTTLGNQRIEFLAAIEKVEAQL